MYSHQATCMGTGFIFQIEDEAGDLRLGELANSAMEILEDANQRFSLYIEDSEITRLVRGELDWSKASYPQRTIREQVDLWRERTHGYFDAKVDGASYDPSGLVKSWATQNAADFLLANGLRSFTINAGGDIYLSPELESPLLHRVGLSNLRSIAAADAGANLILDLSGTPFRAVATSGISERGEHIWRSDTNSEMIQVSVAGVDLVEADIWATAIISGGMEAWELFQSESNDRMRALVTTRAGALFSSKGFTNLLATL